MQIFIYVLEYLIDASFSQESAKHLRHALWARMNVLPGMQLALNK